MTSFARSVPSGRRRILRPSFLWPAAAALGLVSCTGGPAGEGAPTAGATFEPGTPGTILEHPDGGAAGSALFEVDPNRAGGASALGLAGAYWGRLVDVHDVDAEGRGRLVHQDLLVRPDVGSGEGDWRFEVNPLTGIAHVHVPHERGTEPFERALAELEGGLVPLDDAGLADADGQSSLGLPWPVVPRDAALALCFDDLLDPATVGGDTVRVIAGGVPFPARVFVDANHGDLNRLEGEAETRFFSTRVLVDLAVSRLDVERSAEPLEARPSGLPAGAVGGAADVELRIATRPAPEVGQERVLANLSGAALAPLASGTADLGSRTADVVRAFGAAGSDRSAAGSDRSAAGSDRSAAGSDRNAAGPDRFNGSRDSGGGTAFLGDDAQPVVVGVQPAQITQAPLPDASGGPRDFVVPSVVFDSTFCAHTPNRGDVLVQPGFIAVVRERAAPHQGDTVQNLEVRLVVGDRSAWPAAAVGPVQIQAPYEPGTDGGKEACFVRIQPQPAGYPEQPTRGVSTSATVGLLFSEPMAPDSLTAFDSMVLTRQQSPAQGTDYVVGSVHGSADGRNFDFVPLLPLAHERGKAEKYYVDLAAGPLGPTDLVGNPMAYDFPPVRLEIHPGDADETNGGRVTRFQSIDEEPPFGGDGGPLPEWSGQHLYDLVLGRIGPRPLVRFEAVVDESQPLPGLMTDFPLPVQTPLTALGSRFQKVWRYADVGFSLTDPTLTNLDVEGLSWAPEGGQVVADQFDLFEMLLSHGKYLPDEYLDPQTLFPMFPASGLKETFAENQLDPARVVHPRHLGYTISPGDAYQSSTGTLLMPYPLNREVPVEERSYYTWRDTALQDRGGEGGGGADLFQITRTLDQGTEGLTSAGRVQSIGLPLLMDFKVFPDDGAIGLNQFDVSIAANSSARPNFRAFSAGGVSQTGSTVLVNPDLETAANGGFNPFSNPPGATTYGLDNTFYLGAMDLVTRVSRSVSLWFEPTGVASAEFLDPLIEPPLGAQPAGTDVLVAFRGALDIDASVAGAVTSDARLLDGYGDYYPSPELDRDDPNVGITFSGDDGWRSSASEIDGSAYYQVRLTFLSDPETGLSPGLSGLGIAWRE